jgi:hypothetical protein
MMFAYIHRKSMKIWQGVRRALNKQATNDPPRLDLQFLEDRILYSGVALASELIASQTSGMGGEMGPQMVLIKVLP